MCKICLQKIFKINLFKDINASARITHCLRRDVAVISKGVVFRNNLVIDIWNISTEIAIRGPSKSKDAVSPA